MCLRIDNKLTSEYLKKDMNEDIIVWKIVESDFPRYISLYRHAKIPRKGKYKSKKIKHRASAISQSNTWLIAGGAIHCYTAKRPTSLILLRCKASMKDFIAAGRDGDICFSQVEILGEESQAIFSVL